MYLGFAWSCCLPAHQRANLVTMGLDRSLSGPYIDEMILLDVNFKLGKIDWHFLEKESGAYELLNLFQ